MTKGFNKLTKKEQHENSPFMDEMYGETGWKHVIHGDIEDAIKTIKKTKKNKKNT
jgi:hypothetical protein